MPPYSTAWTYTYHPSINSSPLTTNPSIAFWPANSTGGIVVSDGLNNIANPAITTGAVIALISHGRNGYGALNLKQGLNDASLAGADEVQNTNPIIAAGNLRVVKRDTTDSVASGGIFDDVVFTLNASELVTPLIQNATISETASISLNRANDYILGAIITTKDCVSAAPECSYSIPVSNSIPLALFDNVVNYASFVTEINVSTPSNNINVYTITAGDGTALQMSVGQLRGLLARGSGFN